MIDTHSHIYSSEFEEDIEAVAQRAAEAGVEKVILANVDTDSLERIIRLWEKNPEFIVPSIGLHPTDAKEDYREQLSEMEKLIHKYPFKALGETGIDLYWDKTHLKEQIEAFQWHIDKASEMDLPLIIHVRDSFEEVKDVLRKNSHKKLRGVIHSFSGNENDARDILETGDFYFGINGIVTFKKSHLPEALAIMGPERLLLETDAPYLAPVPYRGKRNEPAYMVSTAEKLGEIFGLTVEEIDRITTENAKKLFAI